LNKILEDERIKLSLAEKLRYYKLSIILLVATIFCLTKGFTNFPFENFNLKESPIDKIGIVTLLLSLGSYFYFWNNLKIKNIRFTQSKMNFINAIINNIESNKGWELIQKSDNYLIIETKGSTDNYLNSRNNFISPDTGNRIYIGIGNKVFFVKSLFNLSTESFFAIDNGESKRNETLIINLIKSTANKAN
jgi:hypothetical protein